MAVPSRTMVATLNPWCLMQASRTLTTSSPSKLVAWKPSLRGSLLGPAVKVTTTAYNTAYVRQFEMIVSHLF